jgi:hypothetical protein
VIAMQREVLVWCGLVWFDLVWFDLVAGYVSVLHLFVHILDTSE